MTDGASDVVRLKYHVIVSTSVRKIECSQGYLQYLQPPLSRFLPFLITMLSILSFEF
jgi:hypothetical protein